MKVRIVTRLTIWYVASLAIIIAILATFFVYRLHGDLIRSVDIELSARAEQIAAVRSDTGTERADLADLPAVAGLSHGEYIIQEIEPALGRIEAGNPESAAFTYAARSVQRALRAPIRETRSIGGEAFRLLAVRVGSGATAAVLVVGKSLEGVEATTSHFILLVLLSAPVALALAFAGGYLLSQSALRPITQMTHVAAAINADDLSARVDEPAVDDEVARLARTFNAMLVHVEHAFNSQRRFVADAAHELRTPLAIMRSEVDVTLREIPEDREVRASLESVGDEVDRLIRMADNLLALARIDEEHLALMRAPVQLEDVGSDVVRAMARLASERGVRLDTEFGGASVVGDRERLRQVAVNLLDNAIRHTPDGGTITLATGSETAHAWLRIQDSGSGISDADVERVFARFYRTHEARARSSGGAGLGLAICRAIVEAHQGKIALSRADDVGTVVTVTLPRASA